MLTIEIPGSEFYDELSNSFKTTPPCKVQLEHSLLSISKWESIWKEPFLSKKDFTRKKFQDYVRCMAIGQYNPEVFLSLSKDNLIDIRNYIDDSMTATTFRKTYQSGRNTEVITAELLYYRMLSHGYRDWETDRKSTRLNSSHSAKSRMPSSA